VDGALVYQDGRNVHALRPGPHRDLLLKARVYELNCRSSKFGGWALQFFGAQLDGYVQKAMHEGYVHAESAIIVGRVLDWVRRGWQRCRLIWNWLLWCVL
jgi:hypothetical protein